MNDGGVDDASDEGYTDGIYPDYPKRWRKKEELVLEVGFVHEDNIKRNNDDVTITSKYTILRWVLLHSI